MKPIVFKIQISLWNLTIQVTHGILGLAEPPELFSSFHAEWQLEEEKNIWELGPSG